jgi:hypothetical protein
LNIKENYIKHFFGFLSFLFSFAVYVVTLAPTVGFIDTGELATVCIKLGVAHPTGYPLFTLIGRIFSLIPLGEGIYRLNLMSAFIGSVAVYSFYFLMLFLLNDFGIPKDTLKKFKDNSGTKSFKNINIYFISFTSSLILAYSIAFWNICNGIEVYALHILFLITVTLSFLKACFHTINKNPDKERYWILFAFVLGLSFTNHLTTIFLAPSTIFLYFALNGFNKLSFKRILILTVPFIIGISVYIYFPIRADNEFVSWGYPANLTNMLRHISGKQFSVWMFSSTDVMVKQINRFFSFYPKEFYYFPLIFAILGLISIFNYNRKFFYFTLIIFVFNILYASNYDIHDIESYFILAIITTIIWIGFGIFYVINRINSNKFALALIALIIPLVMLVQNYKECNESKNYFTQDFTMNVFNSARPNSMIISTQWDFWLSCAWYYQFVNGLRPDIYVIDKELLRRSWYMRHIKLHYPEIYERSKSEFETYLIELTKFEDETPRYLKPKTELDKQDLVKINNAFINLLNSLVDRNIDRNIYTTYEIEQNKQEQFGKDYNRVPEGLLLRLTKDKGFDELYTNPEYKFVFTKNEEYYYSFMMKSYYDSYLMRANYLMNFSKIERAEELIKKAIEMDLPKSDAKNLLKKLNDLKNIQKNN